MSLIDKFKSKILNKSDTYSFYKLEYENSLQKEKELKKTIQKINNDLKIKENELKQLNNKFESFDDFLINSFHTPFINAPFSNNFKRQLEFMDLITNKLVSNVKCSDNPLISVIMPVYNRKNVVMNAVNSVLSQSYQNFELILVDDGSSDGTIDVLNEINNEKIKVIITGENNGCPAARNRGIIESQGEIITYLDSDNLWDKDFLAATVGAYVELPDADCIYSAQMRYKNYDSSPERFLFGSLNKSLLHNTNFIDVNTLTHKRHILNDIIGFDDTLTREEDWDFVLRINSKYKVYSVPFLQSKYFLDVADNRLLNVFETKGKTVRKNNFKSSSGYKSTLKCKVTIIIPTVSSEPNIKKCINSILALELNNLDIIISNTNPNIDLSYFEKFNGIKLINSKLNKSFVDSLVQAIEIADDSSDIIILNQNSIITEGSIELMQEYSQKLSDSGLIVSQQVSKYFSKGHVPHAANNYWCDITPSRIRRNIINIPVFYDGEILELSYAPFFCTYIKRNVVNSINFNFKTDDDYEAMILLSEYVRLVLNLKVYHVSDVIVYKNQDRLSNEF